MVNLHYREEAEISQNVLTLSFKRMNEAVKIEVKGSIGSERCGLKWLYGQRGQLEEGKEKIFSWRGKIPDRLMMTRAEKLWPWKNARKDSSSNERRRTGLGFAQDLRAAVWFMRKSSRSNVCSSYCSCVYQKTNQFFLFSSFSLFRNTPTPHSPIPSLLNIQNTKHLEKNPSPLTVATKRWSASTGASGNHKLDRISNSSPGFPL